MTKQQLKACLLHWSQNRLSKLAEDVIPEFNSNPDRHAALHTLAITKDDYPYQEYASWLCGHLVSGIYNANNPKRIQEVIDAFFVTENHTS
jgi:hypothetical protein